MLHPRPRPVCWRRTGFALALALSGGGLLAAAQAASVQEPADLLQRPDAAAPTAGGTTLDRALSVDTHAGQRNLGLLLEARGADDVPGDAGARRATALPQPARAAAAATAAGLTAVPGPTPGAGLPEPAVQREWLGAMPGAAADSPGLLATPVAAADGADLGLPSSGGDAAHEIDPALRGALVRDTVAFLREHRYWLLGALAGVAVAVAGGQAWLRRTGDSPERRAERLGEQRSARRTRRRSSRRA